VHQPFLLPIAGDTLPFDTANPDLNAAAAFHPRHHRNVHAAKLSTLLIEGCGMRAVLAAKIEDG